MSSVGTLVDGLADVLWPTNEKPREYHTRAVVENVSGSSVYVRIKGAPTVTACSKLKGVSVQVGDVALILVTPTGSIVIGVIG